MWKPCGLYLQNISRIQSLLITSTVTILVKPPLSLAWMCTIVSSLDPCLLPCHAFPTPQFLLNNSSHLVPYQPESDHAPPQLSTLQWLPIWQRIKAKVLAVASKAPFGLAPPNPSFYPLLLPASPLTSPSTLAGLEQARHTPASGLLTGCPISQDCSSFISIHPHCWLPHPFSLCSNISFSVKPTLTLLYKLQCASPTLHLPYSILLLFYSTYNKLHNLLSIMFIVQAALPESCSTRVVLFCVLMFPVPARVSETEGALNRHLGSQ